MEAINLKFEADASTPKFRLLAEAVKNAIAEGRLKSGEPLPSVSYVCDRFVLSRDTVFKAYSLLREQGVVMSQPGKGYFIADHTTKVFVLLDTFKAYKEVLYDSFFHSLPRNVIADVNFHHYNPRLFKKLIEDSLGRYSKYIIMPFISDETEKLLKRIPRERLLVIDWNIYTDDLSNVVYQDFGNSLFMGLESVRQQILKYSSFHFLYPDYTYHPYQSVVNFDRFCRTHNIPHDVERNPDVLDVQAGRAYLSVSDRMLAKVLEQCKIKGLVPGQDVGIISYNETPMKKFIDKGITVFSTDFERMGILAARFVSDDKSINEMVPSRMILRNSL
ncbi:MAG: GntR family transcriptional regulator [Marinilabiliaceae bacterium]|nr:GntR family transcriptional regulator [Bacteroidales bacterium]MDD5816159.1 GntR family transcriptional regulator [Bacteroidales bacterium]MDY4520308.1 GntR family transcriptional regulator [Bacteroidales bacterium]